jgi:hypothetical protein
VWTGEQQATFERDGILRLPNAFTRVAAGAMADTVWRFVERKSDVRRTEPDTWLRPPMSFKSLKRDSVFNALVDNQSVRDALDGVFGVGGWNPPRPGVQVLLTFPSPPPWMLPHHLWHMDADFHQPTWPTFAVKMFACVSELQPRGGATLALAGSHRLVAPFGATLDPGRRGGNQVTWGRFMKQHPGLAEIGRPGSEPDRTLRLRGATHDVNGVPVRIVEMCGDPGDVFITHLQVFHCAAPNANPAPRLMLGKPVRSCSTTNPSSSDEGDL